MPAGIPDELLEIMATKFRMLSDATRLAVLRVLMDRGESSVSVVVRETGRSLANVSKHLTLLAQSGLVARRKEGTNVFYKIDDPIVEKICELVCGSILKQLEQTHRREKGLLRGARR